MYSASLYAHTCSFNIEAILTKWAQKSKFVKSLSEFSRQSVEFFNNHLIQGNAKETRVNTDLGRRFLNVSYTLQNMYGT